MSANTMKAVRQYEFGGPEVLQYEDAPIPELKPGEVLVRVHAVGINPRTGTCAKATKRFLPSGSLGCRFHSFW